MDLTNDYGLHVQLPSVSIARVVIRNDRSGKPATFYEIYQEGRPLIYRRYSEFWALNQQLHKKFPNTKFVLPSKKMVGNFDPAFIEQRRLGLELYMAESLSHEAIYRSPVVQEFLDPRNNPDFAFLQSPQRAGWLMVKQTGPQADKHLRNWSRRWMVLKDEQLYYFRSDQDAYALGTMSLRNSNVNQSFASRNLSLNNKLGTFLVVAENQQSMAEWMEAMLTPAQLQEVHYGGSTNPTPQRLASSRGNRSSRSNSRPLSPGTVPQQRTPSRSGASPPGPRDAADQGGQASSLPAPKKGRSKRTPRELSIRLTDHRGSITGISMRSLQNLQDAGEAFRDLDPSELAEDAGDQPGYSNKVRIASPARRKASRKASETEEDRIRKRRETDRLEQTKLEKLSVGATFMRLVQTGAFSNKPKYERIWLSRDFSKLYHQPVSSYSTPKDEILNVKGDISFLWCSNLLKVLKGRQTQAAKKHGKGENERKIFSVVFKDLSLDLQAETEALAEEWIDLFSFLYEHHHTMAG